MLFRRRLLGTLPALLAPGVVAGCAAAPAARLQPRVGPPVEGTPPPDEWFTMTDSAKLPVRRWLPPGAPTAVVLALHGFNDSRDAWEYPAPAFADAGIAVYAPDQRGFGAAPGRGTWPGTAPLVADAGACLAILRARHPGARVVLMGESMGGAIAMLAASSAAEAASRPDATVLLAPAVWGRREMNPLFTTSLWLANLTWPGLRLTGREVPRSIRASDNRAALVRLAEDPLTLRSSNVRVLKGLVDLMGDALEAAPRMPAASLFLYGEQDRIVPAAATAAMWRALPGTPRRALYRQGYHLLLRDQARVEPTADVVRWIGAPDAPLRSSAEFAAAAWLASGQA